ncbi:hypothetical protein [Caballeronia sp. INDeC2]|uniref:hypothetical protein n=1 Tax=Caballeronia sp. INDeC2 TaxID=2921747 RepID=UPI0020291F09|nr:hypothetical protein [Caballeronia sp. INDeC2]
MKQIRIFALALIAFASASCANDPRVLDQRALAGSSTSPATKVLIVIDSKAVIDPRVNAEIEAYKSAMSAAVQSALKPIPTQLIDITLSSRSSNPLGEPALNFRPSHIVQLLPAASSSVNVFRSSTLGGLN